jgi:predicted metalloprotease with PDZ domain
MKILSHSLLATLGCALLISACASLKNQPSTTSPQITATIDLVNVNDDKVQIRLSPKGINQQEVIFYIPQIIPGSYEYSNYGRFVENLRAFDKKGKELAVMALDQNSWKISNAKKLDHISYLVEDTFDGDQGSNIYPMGGTNFVKDEVFLLNLHSMIGYFEGMKETPYRLSIQSPKEMRAFTSLTILSESDSLDVFLAQRYFHIIDNPILYSKPNAISFDLEDIKVGLAVYSPSDVHQAEDYRKIIEEMMIAQKKFLGAANETPSYDILLHLMSMDELEYFGGVMGALEHHTSTTVVFLDEMGSQELTQSLIDVVSHEFFHTLTPLNIHSEEIHNFEYNKALMSKHLWMYEGTTEYFSDLFQINQGLIKETDFYNRIFKKMNDSERFDDTMSFMEMSSKIVEEPYQSNYSNVYLKGALINMCLDIIIREQSRGDRGILWVMQNLAKRYGPEKPFKDDDLIDEIVTMTYPEVAEFFTKHIEGNTPIDYKTYFEKVGLTMGKTQIPLPSIIFKDHNDLFIVPQRSSVGTVEYVVTGLNSTLETMGVQTGDVFLGLDGKMLPEISPENAVEINTVLTPSFNWDTDREFTITVRRGAETHTFSGLSGTPSAESDGIVANPDAEPKSVTLREAWMKN